MRSILPGADKIEPSCPQCGGRTRDVPNPYFGAGLAVHRYLRTCRTCDWVVILRESPPAFLPAVTYSDETTPSNARRRIWSRKS